MALQEGDRVEHLGDDDDELRLYRGHPGLVWSRSDLPRSTTVGFVDGPSLDVGDATLLRRLPFDEYLRRGRRLVAGLHPLEERPVEGLLADGDEWPEGAEPTAP